MEAGKEFRQEPFVQSRMLCVDMDLPFVPTNVHIAVNTLILHTSGEIRSNFCEKGERDMFELLPCPFCGSDAEIKFDKRDQGVFIRCKECDARTKIYSLCDYPVEFAFGFIIRTWNKRMRSCEED